MALLLTEGLGPIRGRRLIEIFGSAEAAISAPPEEVSQRGGIDLQLAAALAAAGSSAHQELERLEALGGWALAWGEDGYPDLLSQIYAPPLVLFGLGRLDEADEKAVAIVGSRHATDYGCRMTSRLAGELVRLGLSVVSGLAMGIDAAAHVGALAAGGRTIGVLGCGLDVDYPRENKDLKARVVERGAILSEYPLDTPPTPWRFPVRNRIIAGLARGVVIAEASRRSGSLITAKHALEAGRTVMALPGPITDLRRSGCHQLIREGAVLVTSGQEVAAEIWPDATEGQPSGQALASAEAPLTELDSTARKLYDLLEDVPRHIDEIIRQSSLAPEEVLGRLLDLELKGLARRLPGQTFVKG